MKIWYAFIESPGTYLAQFIYQYSLKVFNKDDHFLCFPLLELIFISDKHRPERSSRLSRKEHQISSSAISIFFISA